MSVRTLVTEEDSINEDDDDPIVAEENKSKMNDRIIASRNPTIGH